MIGLQFIAEVKQIEYKEIARVLGITPQTVSDWIKGKRQIPTKRLAQLEDYLAVPQSLIGKELNQDDKLTIHYKIIESLYKEDDLIKDSEVIEGEEDNMNEYNQMSLLEETDEGNNQFTLTDLLEQIDKERKLVKTDEIDYSISELVNMYKRGALDIHPEFQRLFRWTPQQKSRFIESILIGIPIPPIFIAEDENSAWDVIDGVQRLSTIFEFYGILKDENGKEIEGSVLVGTKKLKALEGKVWDNTWHKTNYAFVQDKALENKFLYNSRFKIIRVGSESDPDAKYDLFDRLNTGGTKLEPQEVRNCLAIMLNIEVYKWLRKLSYNPDFVNCMPLTEKDKREQADMEYALRFIVYRHIRKDEYTSTDDITDVLTRKMKEICTNNIINLDREREVFDKTFEILFKACGENAFKKYFSQEDRFKGQLMLSSFEIIAIGVANNLEKIIAMPNCIEYLSKKIKDLYTNEEYLKLQQQKISSQRAVTRFTKLTEFGTKYFQD